MRKTGLALLASGAARWPDANTGETMPFSAYDSDAIQLLSTVLSKALAEVSKSNLAPLSPAERAPVARRITRNLIQLYDGGEREPAALMRAVLSAEDALRKWRQGPDL